MQLSHHLAIEYIDPRGRVPVLHSRPGLFPGRKRPRGAWPSPCQSQTDPLAALHCKGGSQSPSWSSKKGRVGGSFQARLFTPESSRNMTGKPDNGAKINSAGKPNLLSHLLIVCLSLGLQTTRAAPVYTTNESHKWQDAGSIIFSGLNSQNIFLKVVSSRKSTQADSGTKLSFNQTS